MTTSTSADEQVESRWTTVVRLAAGLVLLGAGLWAAGRITWWYLADNVAKGGVHLLDPSQVWLPAFVVAVIAAGGIAVLALRRRFRGAGGLVAVALLALVGVFGAGLAVAAYPAVERARVHLLPRDPGGASWATTVPLTVVSSVSEDSADRVTVTGTFMDHGCLGSYLAVTLDRRSGEVLEVADLPGTYYPGTPPAPVDVLREHGLGVEQGSQPFVCLN